MCVAAITIRSFFRLRHKMGEWVPSSVMEAKLQRLMVKGLLPSKEVTGWRAPTSEVVPLPQPGEVVSFIDFHKRGFGIPTSDFLCGFLREHGVQLQHLSPNAVLQQVGFIIMCEAFLGIAPNKDLFYGVFEVKPRKVHGSDGGALAPVGGMNL